MLTRHLPRRPDSRQQAEHDGQRERRREDAPVQVEGEEGRLGKERGDLQQHEGADQTDQPTDQAEHDVFHDELQDQVARRGAEGLAELADIEGADLAETDIPDAKDRLNYVIEMTEKAANTAMAVVEDSSPVAEKLSSQAGELKAQWAKFRARELSPEELRAMGHDVETFFTESEEMMSKLLSGFTEILMAQDFQDLTGQIIRRVINLVEEIEGNLVELIKIQGEHFVKEDKKEEKI